MGKWEARGEGRRGGGGEKSKRRGKEGAEGREEHEGRREGGGEKNKGRAKEGR